MLITEHDEDDYGLPMDVIDFRECTEQSLTTTGDVTFTFDADCAIPQNDFLQQLSNDLEIPLLFEEGNNTRNLLEENDGLEHNMSVDSHHFDGLVDFDDIDLPKWVPQTFPNVTNLEDSVVCSIKDEIKTEPPPSPPSSISSLSSLSEGASSPEGVEGALDFKVILETPPLSPPREGERSPSTLARPCTLVSTNVGTILPTTIISTPQPCIVPQPHAPKISKGVKVIRPKLSCSQMQPRNAFPDNEDSKNSKQAIILTAKEFVALASQIKKGKNDASRGSVTLVSGVASTPITEKTLVSVAPAAPTIACQLGHTKGDLEQAKAMKRQQRMIKNRESACLSRKKKKEYVATLEDQLTQLKKENYQLKTENQALRERLSELGGDFQSDTKSLWMGGGPSLFPTSSSNSIISASQIFSANTKKVTAFFAVLLVVSLNIGPFGGLLQNDQLTSSLRSRSSGPMSTVDRSDPHPPGAAIEPGIYSSGRALLWSLGRGDLPPLGSEEDDDDVSSAEFDVVNASTPHPTCPLPINVTESIRLDSELRGWFGKESWMAANLSASEKGGPLLKGAGPHSWVVPPHPSPMPLQQKLRPVSAHGEPRAPLPSIEPFTNNRVKKKGSKLRQWPLGNPSLIQGREVAVYGRGGGENSRRGKYEYSALLEAIGRREDRFYVVSFSGDHLLLPASAPALNASHQHPRPKMTLLLPAVMPNGTVGAPLDHITMMQIDCEVTDTQLMSVRQGVIPLHLRSRSSSGRSPHAPAAPCNNGTANQGLRKAGATAAALHPYLRRDGVEGRGRL